MYAGRSRIDSERVGFELARGRGWPATGERTRPHRAAAGGATTAASITRLHVVSVQLEPGLRLMCGIVACRTNQPAIEYLTVALRRLEYRGYDSVGVALQTASGELARLRTVGRVAALDGLLRQWPGAPFNGVGIGHTRWATHGSVTEANAHPHADCTGRIFVVHNGIVENALDLRRELTRAGHRFATSVDSEVLSHLIEHELPSVRRSLRSRAERSDPGAMVPGHLQSSNRAPAVSSSPRTTLPCWSPGHTHGDFAASDIAAIADWTEEFRVLDDGDVVELTDGGRWARGGIASAPVIVGRCAWRGRDADLNGYSDFMAKEIDEQPAAACRVIDELAGSVTSGTLWTDRGLASFDRLRVIGCGTSLNAGHVVGNLVRRLGGIPVTCTIASEAARGHHGRRSAVLGDQSIR